jgi:ketosteroid isomerase-like protein
MSHNEVEIVQSCFEAFNRGDIDLALDGVDPAIEFVGEARGTAEDQGARARYHGHAGVRELHALLREAFDEIRLDPDEFRVTSDGVVLVLGRICVRGRGSGAVVESQRAWVFRLRDGKIAHWQTYDEQDEALEAVGLGE